MGRKADPSEMTPGATLTEKTLEYFVSNLISAKSDGLQRSLGLLCIHQSSLVESQCLGPTYAQKRRYEKAEASELKSSELLY